MGNPCTPPLHSTKMKVEAAEDVDIASDRAASSPCQNREHLEPGVPRTTSKRALDAP
jgi:hypothetical protein